mgnify:CR=1 FL=1
MSSVAVVAHSGKTLGGGLDELRSVLAHAGVDTPLWYEVPKSKKAPARVRKAIDKGADLVFVWGGDGMVQRCIDTLAGMVPVVGDAFDLVWFSGPFIPIAVQHAGLERCVSAMRSGGLLTYGAFGALVDRLHERVAIREVVVERRHRDADGVAHPACGERGRPFLGEDLAGRFEDAYPRLAHRLDSRSPWPATGRSSVISRPPRSL